MKSLAPSDSFLAIALVLGLIFSVAYTLVVWPRFNRYIKRHLEKRYGVKFKGGSYYIDPLDAKIIQTVEVQGRGSKFRKACILLLFNGFTFLVAFWPLFLYMFLLFYFREALAPLMNKRF